MSIKDRLRQLEDKVDRIERAVMGDDITVNFHVEDFKDIEAVVARKRKYSCVKHPDPEIISNVMRWNNDNWLESSFVPTEYQRNSRQHLHDCKVYINFDDVPITDALARMRTDEQPIWVMVSIDNKDYHLKKLIAVVDKADLKYKAMDSNNIVDGWDYCRLASIDDLKKAGIR